MLCMRRMPLFYSGINPNSLFLNYLPIGGLLAIWWYTMYKRQGEPNWKQMEEEEQVQIDTKTRKTSSIY